jgi:hypothetical protein
MDFGDRQQAVARGFGDPAPEMGVPSETRPIDPVPEGARDLSESAWEAYLGEVDAAIDRLTREEVKFFLEMSEDVGSGSAPHQVAAIARCIRALGKGRAEARPGSTGRRWR